MFSLFARGLPRTTLSAIHLCARGVASEVGPTKAVYVRLRQKVDIDNKISHQALKEGLAANFGPVERLWLAMPSGSSCIVTFQEQANAQKLMDKGTLEIPPAMLTAEHFAVPRPEAKLRAVDDSQKVPRLILRNISTQFGISAPEIAKVFGQFGKVSVRQPTLNGYPRPFAFLYFETQEAADKALETIRSEEGIILEGGRLYATYYIQEERPAAKYPVGSNQLDASTLWVRDRKYLTEALDITPPFLRTKQGDAGTVIDYRNWHLALGRRFRSLKFWFVLRSFGVDGFQAHIRKGIALNCIFVCLVEKSPVMKLVTPPSFALSVFRLCPPEGGLAELNSLNRIFFGRILARTDIFIPDADDVE
ncbi:hypothetical protein BDZ89DRAFT_1165454 [Hymenopellis radicata]|nr:hypothetical protein BDZ89DRAFT_1165454 [Hymenopellis radicata]